MIPLTSSAVAALGLAVPMPTDPAGEDTLPVRPVAKIIFPILRKELVDNDGTSVAVPIRMSFEPVARVGPELLPIETLPLPVVRDSVELLPIETLELPLVRARKVLAPAPTL